jgi:hypothetical protein
MSQWKAMHCVMGTSLSELLDSEYIEAVTKISKLGATDSNTK